MIKLVVFDFDGVFTDGTVFFDSNNNILKYYNIKDGMAINLLKKNNILTGLISSFSTDKQLLLNDTEKINEHLKFDYYYIGKESKLKILNKWLVELNITYDEIAYIGDDVTDIPILKLVKYSACPNDAVVECKHIVNYTCLKRGGDGCVREFVEYILNLSENIISKNIIFKNLIFKIKNEINFQLDNFNLDDIDILSNIIKKSKNNIYFTGIGKSEILSQYCCNLLKSIGLKCFFLNSINALHGDIGTIDNEDIVIMFSKSGNTHELISLIPFLINKKCKVIGICCDNNSKFEKMCDMTIKLPFNNEIDGEINKIPTNSSMVQLLFSNIFVSKLKENINIHQYKRNHPSGLIGKSLKTIKECLITEYPKLILDNNESVKLHNIFLEMTKYKIGCCFFINNANNLLGILTDGDIRRLLLNNSNKTDITINDINCDYYFESDINKYVTDCKKIIYIPIIKSMDFSAIIIN